MSRALHTLYARARLDDRQINELIGLARGIIADGAVNQAEAEYLLTWLANNRELTENPIVNLLYERVDHVLADGVLDDDEAAELLSTLTRFCAGDVEHGEAAKATTLPLCDPAPVIGFAGARFCFTGTFAFGTRRDCEAAVLERGAEAGGLTQKTKYLVIGSYATDSWSSSAFGRKIEKAVEMRSEGLPIGIVCEDHWVGSLGG